MNTQTNSPNGANAQSCCSTSSCCPSQPSRRAQPKVGRNDPCPCGNGRKFKKCCGRSL
ncbi:SEC-C metal-binding domain-containing protein [Spongiibacter marinus]|uniref:SEC-C metal-binding domain-containing protein n=1 Tax=Spongiibacter marinus TaxID=354246 RepID=UPI000A0606BE|nr:SEC-C metal-binding domain-containing protein [Spongiibacter marinus]